jgi:serine/threonine-protein kinase RsbW
MRAYLTPWRAVVSWPRLRQHTMAAVLTRTVRVAASRAGIRLAADALDGFQAEHGLADSTAWPLHVALDEVLSNVVRHAAVDQAAIDVDVTFAMLGRAVEMTVSDGGPAFDPLHVAEPDLTVAPEDRQPGGLGIHLVKQLMHRVEYARAEGRNRLVMTWRFSRPPQGGA